MEYIRRRKMPQVGGGAGEFCKTIVGMTIRN